MASQAATQISARRLPADERRAQVLREAARLFGTHGFSGTTTRDIAAAVGITEAALYRYFPSKEAMYAAILDERAAASDPLENVEPLVAAGDDRAVFRALALTLFRNVESDPSILRLIMFSALEGHRLSGPFHQKRILRLRDFLTGYIEARIRAGEYREVDARLAARAFMGMVVDHLVVRHVLGQKDLYPQPAEEVADTFVSIFLGGMRADSARAARSEKKSTSKPSRTRTRTTAGKRHG